MAELVPIAHAGHWLPYVVPAVVVLVAVLVATIREGRRAAAGERGEGSSGDGPPPR